MQRKRPPPGFCGLCSALGPPVSMQQCMWPVSPLRSLPSFPAGPFCPPSCNPCTGLLTVLCDEQRVLRWVIEVQFLVSSGGEFKTSTSLLPFLRRYSPSYFNVCLYNGNTKCISLYFCLFVLVLLCFVMLYTLVLSSLLSGRMAKLYHQSCYTNVQVAFYFWHIRDRGKCTGSY